MEKNVLDPRVVSFVIIGMLNVVIAATTTAAIDDDCQDRRDCSAYDIRTSCCGVYEAFARYNCPRHCRFCKPKVPDFRQCNDTIPNCDQYNADLCSNRNFESFVKEKCAGFCKICDKPLFVPECAGNGTSTGTDQTTPEVTVQTTQATTTIPADKCISKDGRFYSVGETWHSASCREECECMDFVNNDIECRPISCPKWIHNCDLVVVPDKCCPILKCNYFYTIHGPRTLLGKK